MGSIRLLRDAGTGQNQVLAHPLRALLVSPYLQRAVPDGNATTFTQQLPRDEDRGSAYK